MDAVKRTAAERLSDAGKHDRICGVDAFEWVEYNSIRVAEYVENAPIIMHRLD